MENGESNHSYLFPSLSLDAWQATNTSLHMYMQIVGKIQLALSPMMNHWWHATLKLSSRGMTTSSMPYGHEAIQIDFDFIDHLLYIQSSSGETRIIPLAARPVADFYHDVMEALHSINVEIKIWTVPVEVEERIPFEQDYTHTAYDPEYVHRFWRVLLQVDRVMKVFRGRFCGKASPVHFFWGSFDLAASRFSGRKAPIMENAFNVAKYVMREAYSYEVSSIGFWPGGGLGEAAFYAYIYPEPPGYSKSAIQPAQAYYHPQLKEFVLPYEAVRTSGAWDKDLLDFFQTTYEAGANLAKWERSTLETSFLISPESKK
jgi:hypothetical protein